MPGWLHRVLDLPEDAPPAELRRAYAAQLRAFHPDHCPDSPDNRRRVALIRAAHQVLRDDALRREHDRTGAIPRAALRGDDAAPLLEGGGLVDLAKGLLRVVTQEQPSHGKDKTVRLRLTLDELIRGTSRVVDVPRLEACPDCQGSGSDPEPAPLRCHVCSATGTLAWRRRLPMAMACPFCSGHGIVVRAVCRRCEGDGYMMRARPIRVTLPPGVHDGERTVLKGEGERGRRGGRHGDLIFVTALDPAAGWRRDKADLLISVGVPDGATALTILHPLGEVRVPIPDGFSGGTLLVEGHGLPRRSGDGARGDLLVEVVRSDGAAPPDG